MGWSAEIKCDREIKWSDVEEIFEQVPVKERVGNTYLGNGYGDTFRPDVLSFSGSWLHTGEIASAYQTHMVAGLKARGYEIVSTVEPR